MTETYCQLPDEIMRATHWISKTTGEVFSFTGDQKIIWAQMMRRYRFFSSQGKEWFDNQDKIAEAVGCSVNTVKRFLNALKKHGYLQVQKLRLRGFVCSNVYTITAELEVCTITSATRSSGHAQSDVGASSAAMGELPCDWSVIASQEVVEQPVPFFEDIPIGAYADMPLEAPVVVHETSRGFADTLDAVVHFEVPRLTKGLATSSGETDLWG